MANMIDYMKWRGDLSFSQDPFNEIDNIILSQMSYTDIDKAYEDSTEMTVAELSRRYFHDHTIEEAERSKSFVHLAPVVLDEMSKCARFKDLKVHDYFSEFDESRAIQFAAIHIDLNEDTAYIAFRGTDDTLAGWHEDFDMAYKQVPSQVLAIDYLLRTMKDGRKYYIGGHSKGGNLALYASMKMDAAHQSQIIWIYDNDGPGLSPDMYTAEEYTRIKNKYTKYVPGFDIIGNIFDPSKHDHVVKSTGFSAYQHDAMTWQLMRTSFEYLEDIDENSKVMQKALNDLLTTVALDKRKEFIDELFEALDRAGVKTVSDMLSGKLGVLTNVVSSLSKMDPQAKEVATMIFSAIKNNYEESIKKKFKIL